MPSFMDDLKYHEGFLLRQIAPLERENEDKRVSGFSFKERQPTREAIAGVEKTLADVRLLIKREYAKPHVGGRVA